MKEFSRKIWQAIDHRKRIEVNGGLFDPYVIVTSRHDSREQFLIGKYHLLTKPQDPYRMDIDDIKSFEATEEQFERRGLCVM